MTQLQQDNGVQPGRFPGLMWAPAVFACRPMMASVVSRSPDLCLNEHLETLLDAFGYRRRHDPGVVFVGRPGIGGLRRTSLRLLSHRPFGDGAEGGFPNSRPSRPCVSFETRGLEIFEQAPRRPKHHPSAHCRQRQAVVFTWGRVQNTWLRKKKPWRQFVVSAKKE